MPIDSLSLTIQSLHTNIRVNLHVFMQSTRVGVAECRHVGETGQLFALTTGRSWKGNQRGASASRFTFSFEERGSGMMPRPTTAVTMIPVGISRSFQEKLFLDLKKSHLVSINAVNTFWVPLSTLYLDGTMPQSPFLPSWSTSQADQWPGTPLYMVLSMYKISSFSKASWGGSENSGHRSNMARTK